MTNEMIERVARALAKRHYENRFGTSDQDHILMNVNGNWHIFSGEARTAIEATREPTKEMVLAAYDGSTFQSARETEISDCWRLMVDTALADPLPVVDRLTHDGFGSREVEEK